MNVWLTHAIFGFAAWGLLAPAGIIIVAFRTAIFRSGAPIWDRHHNPDEIQGQAWIILHRHINETVILLTWILFGLAVVGVKRGHHFRNSHQIVGFAIFLWTFPLWTMGRLLMPPKVPRNGSSSSNNNSIERTTERTTLISRGDDGSNERAVVPSKESILIMMHRLLGGVMLAAGLWEIYSGSLMLFSKKD
ncbi:hypothetical protein IV203_017209 [Nitzschia inconspicua]|uniref:Uncharacterized protein n=1 Tax=Nitzschia inconspicua TaxID=303405 RepID=A0A9K3KSI6_9STRA|nr:hypothetical protein IV203_017209 [Nitzschia inconspicua]